MAAIDPGAQPDQSANANGDAPPRATLKIIYDPNGPGQDEESDEDSEDEDYLKGLLEGAGSDEDDEDEESSDDEEEKNGGPSDPSKTKKARKQAAVEQMMKALAENDSDDEMDDAPAANGELSKRKKGKAKATDLDEEETSDEDDEMEELVLCTLDPLKVGGKFLKISHVKSSLTDSSRTTNNHSILLLARTSAHSLRFLELTLSTLQATTSYQQTMATTINTKLMTAKTIPRIMTTTICHLMQTNSTRRKIATSSMILKTLGSLSLPRMKKRPLLSRRKKQLKKARTSGLPRSWTQSQQALTI